MAKKNIAELFVDTLVLAGVSPRRMNSGRFGQAAINLDTDGAFFLAFI